MWTRSNKIFVYIPESSALTELYLSGTVSRVKNNSIRVIIGQIKEDGIEILERQEKITIEMGETWPFE